MKFNIFGVTVLVRREDISETQALGMYNPTTNTIIIHSGQNKIDSVHTLLHELFHATWQRCSFNQVEVSPDMQELICDTFATMLVENFNLMPKQLIKKKKIKPKK